MKNRNRSVLPIAAAMLVVFAPLGSNAQVDPATKAEVEKIAFEALPSPDISLAKSKSFKAKDWLEVEAKVRVRAVPVPESGFVDQITVKWFMAVENKGAGGNATALITKEITYVNVPVEEDFYVSAYLSPASVKRISGADRAGERVVKAVAVHIHRNGTLIGFQNSGPTGKWWDDPKLGQMTGVLLLDKNETPFKTFWWDRYGEIQEAGK